MVHRQSLYGKKKKETLVNAPVMMAPIPIAGKELKLYLAFNDNAIGIVLAQDDQNGQEKPITMLVEFSKNLKLDTLLHSSFALETDKFSYSKKSSTKRIRCSLILRYFKIENPT